jgi:hypothetical protein
MDTNQLPRVALPAFLALFLSAAAAAQTCDGLGVVKLPATDVVPTLSGGEQEFPEIAAGAGAYLAAWADDRSDFGSHTTSERSRHVFARRIGPDGVALDEVAFRVAGGLGRKDDVRVSWNGESWFVAWVQEVPTPFFKTIAIAGARVAADGTVLDAEPILVRTYAYSSNAMFALASDGDGWAVVCQAAHGIEALVEGHLIAGDGTVTPGPAPLLTSTWLWANFELCFANGKYLLAAGDPGDNKGRFLAPDLAPLGPTFSLASKDGARIATDGSDYLLTYTVSGFVGSRVFVRPMSASGALGVPQAVTPDGVEHDYHPAVAWNGTTYVVAYTHGLSAPPELRAARVAQSGTVLDFGGVPVATGADSRDPEVASLGDGGTQMVWVRSAGIAPYVSDVLSTHLDASGAAAPAEMLGNGRPRQGDPDLAAGGEGYLSVFVSGQDTLPRVVAQRLDRFGNPLDADVIEIASGPFLGVPRVAWNGEHFLVIWQDLRDFAFPSFEIDDATFGRRVAPDGTLLDAGPFLIMLGGMADVDAVGSTFLVAASQAVSTEIRRIFAARVDAAGTVLDTTSKQIGGNYSQWPAVAAFDDRWLVTWQSQPTHDNPSSSVRYTVVLPDATSLGSTWVSGGSRPAVAASDSVGLILISPEVRALRVGKDGQPLGGVFPLVDQPNLQLEPAAAWTGAEFVVAWEDQRDFQANFDDRHDVYATRVLEDGTVVTFDGCPVSATPEHDQMPVVSGRDGDSLIAFAKYEPQAPAANVRVAYARGSEWTGIEGGIAGVAGLPVLDGDGALVPSGTLQFALFGAAPSAPTLHVVGLARVDLPFFGGLLIPAPDVFLTTATGPGGAVTISAPLPATLPAGLQLWVQSWVLDGGAAQGLAASNAIAQ